MASGPVGSSSGGVRSKGIIRGMMRGSQIGSRSGGIRASQRGIRSGEGGKPGRE